MNEYALGAAPELDRNEIREWIAEDNIDASDSWIGKLFDAFKLLARNPGMSLGATILPFIRSCSCCRRNGGRALDGHNRDVVLLAEVPGSLDDGCRGPCG